MIEIKNLPPYHEHFVVAKNIDGDYWFWGSWSEEKPAYEAAHRIGGYVFERETRDEIPETWLDEMINETMDNLNNLHIVKGPRA